MEADPKDINNLEKALNDAAAKAAALWTTFVTFQLYFAIAFGSVTHRDLLLSNPIKLPILNVDLPLVGFFVIGPSVLAIFQFYVFLQLFALAKKAESYDVLLREGNSVAADRQYLRQRLDPFFVLQSLVGPREQRSGPSGFWLRLIAWITLVGAPVLILLQAQFTFLPYHKTWALWLQRCTVLSTLIVIWYYWPRIFAFAGPRAVSLGSISLRVLGSIAIAFVAVCSVSVATFPGEWADETFPHLSAIPTTWRPIWSRKEDWTSLHRLLFAGEINPVSSRPSSLFSDRIVVADQTIVDPQTIEKAERGISLRGRDLRNAVFSRADLRKVDFTGSNLDYANIDHAKLDGAKFGCGSNSLDTSGVDFFSPEQTWPADGCTWLRMADLSGSQLRGANFDGARLQGVLLNQADVRGANSTQARLQGSSIDHAILDGALFVGAKLQGASVERSELWGVDFSEANLSLAWLFESQLQGVSLSGANANGADLHGGLIWHTTGQPSNTNKMRWGAPSHNSKDDQLSSRPLTKVEFPKWLDQTKTWLSYHQRPDDLQGMTFSSLDPTKSTLEEATSRSIWEQADKDWTSSPPIALVEKIACSTEATYVIVKRVIGEYPTADARQLIDALKNREVCQGSRLITEAQFNDLQSIVAQNLDSSDQQSDPSDQQNGSERLEPQTEAKDGRKRHSGRHH